MLSLRTPGTALSCWNRSIGVHSNLAARAFSSCQAARDVTAQQTRENRRRTGSGFFISLKTQILLAVLDSFAIAGPL
jgi:hypothetical protein